MEIKINELNPSKALLPEVVKNITEGAIEGILDPVRLSTQLDFVIKACTDSKAIIKDKVLEVLESDRLRKDYYGYKVEIAEVGVSYDFSNCNDEELTGLYEDLESLKEKIKDRENFLKALKAPMTIVNDEHGDVTKIHPPVRRSTTSPKFSLK